MKKHLLLSALIPLLLLSYSMKAQSIFSDFNTDSDGWLIAWNTSSMAPGYVTYGGNPGGYITADYTTPTPMWSFLAPPKFTGNMLNAYGHSLSFDLLLENLTDPQFDSADVILVGGGHQIVYNVPTDSISGWQNYTVILKETAGWHLDNLQGAAPSPTVMQAVLSSLTKLEIRAIYSTGFGTSAIDNVYLSLSEAYSNFTTDYEGWRIYGDAQGGTGLPNYHSTGGNPGGFLSAVDDATGGTWYWQAPGKFLGDMSQAYGFYLKYEIKQSALTSQFDNYDIIMQGPAFNLVYNTPNNPDTTWTSYSIVMSETSGWHVNDTLGPVPTKAEFMSVISDLQNLYIRGEFIVGADSGCLDNVSLGYIQGIQNQVSSYTGELTAYPNPAKESVSLSFFVRQPGYFTISLLTETGIPCQPQKEVFCSAGKQLIQLPLKDFAAGMYCCLVKNGTQTLMAKIIKTE